MVFYHTFTWPADPPANEVYVTGSFDNWSRSAPLVKELDGSWSVSIPLPSEKTVYKFVVDNQWLVDPNSKIERDSSGQENNVIEDSDIAALSSSNSAAVIPESAIPMSTKPATEQPPTDGTMTEDEVVSLDSHGQPEQNPHIKSTSYDEHVGALNAAPGIAIPANAEQIPELQQPTKAPEPAQSTQQQQEGVGAFHATPGIALPNNPQMAAAFKAEPAANTNAYTGNGDASTTSPAPKGKESKPKSSFFDKVRKLF
ncbi:immunoglobulin E-set [Kockiozyma suomiensis]|uniref:immunoglobulin E-set n=1 Tax=Kockiozyma suomiensis TaxID=1337062 RepID=UPI00334336FD